jgi:hypothetical protein
MRYIIEFQSKEEGKPIKTTPFSDYDNAFNFLMVMQIMHGYQGRIIPEIECCESEVNNEKSY